MIAEILIRLLVAAAGGLAMGLAYFIVKLVRHRRFYRNLASSESSIRRPRPERKAVAARLTVLALLPACSPAHRTLSYGAT